MASSPFNPGQGQFSALVLNGSGTDPQNTLFIGPEDSVVLVYWSSVSSFTIVVTCRVLAPDGSVNLSSFPVPANSSRIQTSQIIGTGQGLLLSASVQVQGLNAVKRGQMYAQLLLIRGGLITTTQTTQQVCAGYIANNYALTWPFPQFDANLSGFGNIRSITGTTPAAGAEVSEVVPTGAFWRLVSIRLTFTTSAVVVNRLPALAFTDGANSFASAIAVNTQPAGAQRQIFFAPSVPLTGTGFSVDFAPFPTGILLPAAFRITTLTLNLAAGDQYSGIQYVVEEWLQL